MVPLKHSANSGEFAIAALPSLTENSKPTRKHRFSNQKPNPAAPSLI
ncbi:hypothetical protein [Nostoc sp.]